MDINTQNVFAELLYEPNHEEFDKILWAPCIQIAGLGKVTEVSDEFDGRKEDIFQSAFILAAMISNKNDDS
jgi:hypothetical protein